MAYRDIILCYADRCVSELLVADLEDAALSAGRTKAVVRGVQNVAPKAPGRHAAPFVIPKPVGACEP